MDEIMNEVEGIALEVIKDAGSQDDADGSSQNDANVGQDDDLGNIAAAPVEDPPAVPNPVEPPISNDPPVKLQRLSRKKVVCCGAIMSVVSVLIGFSVWLAVRQTTTEKTMDYPKELELLSQFYLDSMDSSVQPCDDFYSFVCGKAIRRYKADEKTDFGTLKLMEEQVLRSLENLLAQPQNVGDSKLVKEFKVFYEACTDEKSIEAEGFTPMKKVLIEMGGWPLLGTNNSLETVDWVDLVGRINSAGFFMAFPFRLGYHPDPVNPTKTSPVFYQFLDAQLKTDSERNIMTDNMTSIAESLGAVVSKQLEEDVAKCVEFESNLSKIAKPDGTPKKFYSVAALPTNSSGIPWQRLLNNIFVSSDVQLKDVDNVVIRYPDYNERVADLLRNTTDNTVKNYIIWKVVESASAMLPVRNHSVRDVALSEKKKEERSLECLKILGNRADVGVGYVYIEEFFNKTVKTEAELILSKVRAETDKYLQKNEWMSSEAKAKIMKNFVDVKEYVAYADETVDVENLYHNLTFQRNATAFSNFLALMDFHRRFALNMYTMSQRVDQLLIPYRYALEAQGGFLPSINSTFILAGLLQSPLFHPLYPTYVNYGSLGYVIGHEVTHSLRILSTFKDITSGPSSVEFKNRTDCLERRYGNYVIGQVNQTVNGTKTLEENIGDVIGLHVAYNAYKKAVNGNTSSESQLPNLDYTNAQMYWIAATSVHCRYFDDSEMLDYIATNKHSPPEARIKVGFGNIEEFASAFNCPVGKTMNPLDRCILN